MKNQIIFLFLLATLSFSERASAKSYFVGYTKTYPVPSSVMTKVSDGDTVEIAPGLYSGDVGEWTANNLLIRCTEGMAHIEAAGKNFGGKAIWVITGNNTRIENIEFSGCMVPDKNGAGIRQEGPNLHLRHCYFHDNENGILTSANDTSDILFEACEFARNGYGDGQSHNMYIGNVRNFSMRFCYSHHAKIGHCVKSRAMNNYIYFNRIMDEDTGSSSYLINLPNGGYSAVVGNIMMKGSKAQNRTLIDYGSEGFSNPQKYLFAVNNTLVSLRPDSRFVTVAVGVDRAHIYNNIFVGTGRTATGLVDTERNIFSADMYSLGFADSANFDYRPKKYPGRGIYPETINNKPSLAPSWEYKHPTDSTQRQYDIFPTLGALEPIGNSVSQISSIITSACYPNPFSEKTTIKIDGVVDGNLIEITVFNELGEKILSKDAPVNNSQINFGRNNLSSGVYYYIIYNSKGEQIAGGKFVVV
jgi:hypothetical protein